MVNKHESLCCFLGIDTQGVVSGSHLPILLQKVKLAVFEQLLYQRYKIVLSEEEKVGFSGDGKELRGSIESGNTRGESVGQFVRHSDRAPLSQSYHNGKKESEQPGMRQLLVESGAVSQKVSFEALHLSPQTTQLIAQAGGTYLIGLKAHQAELLQMMEKNSSYLTPVNQKVTLDKGHGRIEKRHYFQYAMGWECFDEPWQGSDFQSLYKLAVVVEREMIEYRTGKQSQQIAYYLSNGKAEKNQHEFKAIREHWTIEVNNHIPDVTLREDDFRTKKSPLQKFLLDLELWLSKL